MLIDLNADLEIKYAFSKMVMNILEAKFFVGKFELNHIIKYLEGEGLLQLKETLISKDYEFLVNKYTENYE